MKGVRTVVADQCQFELTTRIDGGGIGPARKRTRFMPNAPSILEELGRLCQGGHKHQPLVNNRAAGAAIYPTALCRAICRGLVREIEMDRDKVRRLTVVRSTDLIGEIPETEEDSEYWAHAWDDVSGKFLDSRKVVAARRLEIDYVNNKQVWKNKHRSEAFQEGYKIVGTRWIDVDKGDEENQTTEAEL